MPTAGIALAVGLLTAVAGRAADPLTPLLACRTVADPTARLVCFDRESAKLSGGAAVAARSPAAPAPAGLAAPASPAGAAALESFGVPEGKILAEEVAAGARPAELTRIDAHLSAISVTVTGLATFKLDNGQVWRQLVAEGDLLAKPGDTVSISRGVFHSYWLQVKSGRGCKVTRVL